MRPKLGAAGGDHQYFTQHNLFRPASAPARLIYGRGGFIVLSCAVFVPPLVRLARRSVGASHFW